MKRCFYFFIVLVALFTACKNDDDVPSRMIFEFTSRISPGNPDHWWIILHDNESGELIDYKQVLPNTTATFESTKKIAGGKLTVSFFRASATPGGVLVDVYSDIDVGAKWGYLPVGVNPKGSANQIGTYPLEITNVPSLFDVTVTDGYSELTYQTDIDYEDETITADVSATAADHLIYLDPGVGDPKYYEIEEVEDAVPVSIDYNDFKSFDKYLRFDLPDNWYVSLFLSGDYSDVSSFYNGYIFESYQYGTFGPRKQVSLGFLNSIPNYYIQIRSGNWEYASQGAPPASIEFADNTGYSTSGTKPDNYKVTTTKDYVYSNSYFGYNTAAGYLYMSYFFPKGQEKVFDVIPEELATTYNVDKTLVAYSTTKFEVKGRSYADYIRFRFDDTYDKNTTYMDSFVYGTN